MLRFPHGIFLMIIGLPSIFGKVHAHNLILPRNSRTATTCLDAAAFLICVGNGFSRDALRLTTTRGITVETVSYSFRTPDGRWIPFLNQCAETIAWGNFSLNLR